MNTQSKYTLAAEDARFVSNHWAMFGAGALVRKVGRKWLLADICRHPGIFKTKTEAMAAVTALVLSNASDRATV